MREKVSTEWLRKEIDARLGYPLWEGRNFWTSVERRKKRDDGEVNWRYSYNAGETPPGFDRNWQDVRKEYEERYELAND
jgi:hypothetical protein